METPKEFLRFLNQLTWTSDQITIYLTFLAGTLIVCLLLVRALVAIIRVRYLERELALQKQRADEASTALQHAQTNATEELKAIMDRIATVERRRDLVGEICGSLSLRVIKRIEDLPLPLQEQVDARLNEFLSREVTSMFSNASHEVTLLAREAMLAAFVNRKTALPPALAAQLEELVNGALLQQAAAALALLRLEQLDDDALSQVDDSLVALAQELCGDSNTDTPADTKVVAAIRTRVIDYIDGNANDVLANNSSELDRSIVSWAESFLGNEEGADPQIQTAIRESTMTYVSDNTSTILSDASADLDPLVVNVAKALLGEDDQEIDQGLHSSILKETIAYVADCDWEDTFTNDSDIDDKICEATASLIEEAKTDRDHPLRDALVAAAAKHLAND